MHEPIHFQPKPDPDTAHEDGHPASNIRPKHIDLKKDSALTIKWSDGRTSVYPIALLRKLSPSADARELRKEMQSNPLTVLPAGAVSEGPITATDIEMVGHYAISLTFSDGHNTGIYTWSYLRQIDPRK